MTEVNIPLLRKMTEWVEEQDQLPEIDREWYQPTYIADAPWRATNMMAEIYANADSRVRIGEMTYRELVEVVESHCGTAYCVAGKVASDADPRYARHDTVGRVAISEFAADLLGLSEHQAAILFAGENTAEDIRRIAEIYAGEPL